MAGDGNTRLLRRSHRRCPGTPLVNELQIEAMVGRLGDAGITAVAQALQGLAEPTRDEMLANAGNLAGTLI